MSEDFQMRCALWVSSCFGDRVLMDHRERALRVVEEALELGQAMGLSQGDVDALRDQVYSKPIGDAGQEVAGVLFTTLAAAESMGMDGLTELGVELIRVNDQRVMDKIKAKKKYRNEAVFK